MAPDAYRGDIVADETIIDLAGQSQGLGSRDEKRCGAAYSGAYYIRDREDHSLHREIGSRRVIKGGVGIGVTAISRIGAPGDVYGVAPVITAVSIGKPSSGSVEELERAIRYHQQNDLDQRSRRGRLPLLTVDMGYNVKKSFNDLLLSAGYAPVVRYPTTWRTVVASDVVISDMRPPGAMQISGDFYCPAAHAYMGDGKLVQKTQALLEANDDSFERHDARIEKLFPLLMGTNSRPYRRSSRRGRPRRVRMKKLFPCELISCVQQSRGGSDAHLSLAAFKLHPLRLRKYRPIGRRIDTNAAPSPAMRMSTAKSNGSARNGDWCQGRGSMPHITKLHDPSLSSVFPS